jgi:hypothetical protein
MNTQRKCAHKVLYRDAELMPPPVLLHATCPDCLKQCTVMKELVRGIDMVPYEQTLVWAEGESPEDKPLALKK